MSSQSQLPSLIPDQEILSRFVLTKNWIRSDNSIRHHAFMPPADLNLSVTASTKLSEENIWQIGLDDAQKRPNGELKGRADITALNVRSQELEAVPDPIPDTNIHHVHIIGWSAEKPLQKIKALELADAAHFVPS